MFHDRNPRATAYEIDAQIAALGNIERISAEALGERVKLLFKERHHLRIRTIFCHDRSREWVAAFYREQRNQRQKLRARARRAAERSKRQEASLSPRVRECRSVLTEYPQATRAISEQLVFRKRNGRRLDSASQLMAVTRCLNALKSDPEVLQRYDAGTRGLRIRLAWLKRP